MQYSYLLFLCLKIKDIFYYSHVICQFPKFFWQFVDTLNYYCLRL